MGASHPVGIAADWLTSSWAQNSGMYKVSPAGSVAEEVASKWLLELLKLPSASTIGFTTGATMASFICLSAARSEVLAKAGWNLEEDGFNGAPKINIFLGEQAHSTIYAGLRYLGFGTRQLIKIKTDQQGRMDIADLEQKFLAAEGPKIIICQAGHINSGAFDPFEEIVALAKQQKAWVHVDGAFGLWAQAVPEKSHLCKGLEDCDSWSVDGHKWLQVPYDSGFAIVRNSVAHRRAMDISASYLVTTEDDGRSPSQYVPELSRRAKGFAVWAVLQALGKKGIAEMVSRHCSCATHLQKLLTDEEGIHVLNDVVLNQLAIAFGDPEDSDSYTVQVIEAIQQENTVYVNGANWQEREIMRISVISRETSLADIELLAESIIRAWRLVKK